MWLYIITINLIFYHKEMFGQTIVIPGQGGQEYGQVASSQYSQHAPPYHQAYVLDQSSQGQVELSGHDFQTSSSYYQAHTPSQNFAGFSTHNLSPENANIHNFLENSQLLGAQPTQLHPPLSQGNFLPYTLPMEANALGHSSSSTIVLPASNIYVQLVNDIMEYEWRYPHQSNVPRPESPKLSSSVIQRLQKNTFHSINICLSRFLISESTSKLLWARLENIYLNNMQCLQEIQDSIPIVLTTLFEDSFIFPAPITSEQLKKELNSFIYPEFEARLLVSTFCGGQEIPTPLSDSSVTRHFAINLLKSLLESRKQKINQTSAGDLFFPLLDKTSRDVIEWWRLCLPEQVVKLPESIAILDQLFKLLAH
ncbi:hypothetical protein HD554DRAFT_1193873 [Boletus coccyginus]|nr:hypothetical protein HD554DRAFT_1193873 [Boletus coccyginus]